MLNFALQSLAFGLGGNELLIVFLVILLLFGGAKIPQLMRGVGRGVGELQKGLEEGKKIMETSIKEDEREPSAVRKE